MSKIHSTAIIAEGTSLGKEVEIGPYCYVGDDVSLRENVRLLSHVVIEGKTTIGQGTTIYPFSSIGHIPQDIKYKGEEESRLEIGEHVVIREHVTINPGTKGGGGITRIGNHGFFMVGCHIAHDCIVGNHVIMANNAVVAGHCDIGDYAVFGGKSSIRQFAHVGRYSFIAGHAGVTGDVIPFCSTMGYPSELTGLNAIGLKRHDFGKERIRKIWKIYQTLFSDKGQLSDRIEEVRSKFSDNPDAVEILNFIKNSQCHVIQPRKGASRGQPET
ncbi:MAG: acyl-ACP--UDP-N-acetylglucosamine O-acyltransferase [Parvularculales bacterium]